MNTVTPAIDQFCAEVRDLYAKHGGPITSEEDPRFVSMLKNARDYTWGCTHEEAADRLQHDRERDGELLGYLWFRYNQTLPPAPIPAPAWASRTTVGVSGRNEVSVAFTSAPCASGIFSVFWEQYVTIVFADGDGTDPGSGHERAGDVISQDVTAQVLVNGEQLELPTLTAEDLRDAASALTAVAQIFEKTTARLHQVGGAS